MESIALKGGIGGWTICRFKRGLGKNNGRMIPLSALWPMRRCLDYSKVLSDVTERWLLA